MGERKSACIVDLRNFHNDILLPTSNSGTSGTDFWKSTLAVLKSLYEQLSGHDSGVEHAEVELT